jgi:type I restriction enzyme R subunit
LTPAPEQEARKNIDRALAEAGWYVQSREELNLHAGRGVAVREFPLEAGGGFVDYLLFVDGRACGVLEAKKAGHTLSSVEPQADAYAAGLPATLKAPVRPLPFVYLSTGVETRFINLLDPDPRTRRISNVPHVHRPETLAEWLDAKSLDTWVKALPETEGGFYTAADDSKPSTLRSRLSTLPPIQHEGLRACQFEAIQNLERSLKANRPRALVQMATGAGKTYFAANETYRLIKFGGARRVLFLVDRTNLGEQAEKEFQGFRTPDDHRKFTELYNVQHLQSNTIGSATKIAITTVQRLYSMLKGEPELDPDLEEGSVYLTPDPALREPLPVIYNPTYPPEYFDVIFVDECHRSIYTVWRQVLEYFDAFLVGLTATPALHTFGFFNKNLVMEYPHERAVADGVNVDFEIYKIRTRISEQGATVEARPENLLGWRDRQTRQVRWGAPDEDVTYTAQQLDRAVVSPDQIRTIIRTYRDRLFTEIFPGRTQVPKTLIFAKDDSHAEEIVKIVREEFGRGNAFCQKITYKVTGKKPKDLIQEFRNGYDPRIAVTVDLVATGTDIKPIEVVMFMRSVRSRLLFEQMKGRGVRVIDANDLKAVTPDAVAKTHFVVVDCVGFTETDLADTRPLDCRRSASLESLLEHVGMGGTDPAILSSLASRLSRLARRCGPEEEERIAAVSSGVGLTDLSRAIVGALDPDRQVAQARVDNGLPAAEEPTDVQRADAADKLLGDAVRPLSANPQFRKLLPDLKRDLEQIIDVITSDELIEAGASPEAREKARDLVQSFEHFLAENKNEIEALQVFYSEPYGRRLRFRDIKKLAQEIGAPPRGWTSEKLWRAYAILDQNKVRGASGKRLLTDIVSLVRHALHQDDELVPYAEKVRERFDAWMEAQRAAGRQFTEEQVRWLKMMRDHVATSLEIEFEDFDSTPFSEQGGRGRVSVVFGGEFADLLRELNEALAA